MKKAWDHLREVGLEEYVEIREGDALETLQDLEGPIDFMLNDGFPPYALPVLKLVAPHLRRGAAVVADNVGAFKADHAASAAAPGMLREPPTTSIRPKSPLWASKGRGGIRGRFMVNTHKNAVDSSITNPLCEIHLPTAGRGGAIPGILR